MPMRKFFKRFGIKEIPKRGRMQFEGYEIKYEPLFGVAGSKIRQIAEREPIKGEIYRTRRVKTKEGVEHPHNFSIEFRNENHGVMKIDEEAQDPALITLVGRSIVVASITHGGRTFKPKKPVGSSIIIH